MFSITAFHGSGDEMKQQSEGAWRHLVTTPDRGRSRDHIPASALQQIIDA